MAACVDAIAAGRLELGIGAGWFRPEYDTWGYDYPSTSDRLDMLEEAVQLIRAIWTESPVHFVGRHYKVDGVDMAPKPVQRPHPPIWIGSSGERRGLRIVAALADGWNVAGSVQNFAHKHAVLRAHCDAIGRDPAEIKPSWKGDVVCGATERDVERMLDPVLASWRARGFTEYATAENYRRDHLVGTPAQIIDRIEAYRAAGCRYYVCDLFDTPEGLDRLAADVLPYL
jgi:alkanesulfonate monooxygenase SsuD/methylene tetrahydromethanopterin reductase-like flavin-dependent oxidoreductase (luciferase family)